jgi:hypothetical protein
MRIPLLLLAIAVFATAPRPVSAAVESRADELAAQAMGERRLGRNQRALELFEAAYEVEETPYLMAQIALCENDLQRWASAYEHIDTALRMDGPKRFDDRARADLERLRERIKMNTGELEVDGSPAGAEVWVNTLSKGVLPLSAPLILDPGAVEVRIDAAGFNSEVKRLRIRRGEKQRLLVHLSAAPLAEIPASGGASVSQGGTNLPLVPAIPADLASHPNPLFERGPPPAPPAGPVPAWVGYVAGAAAIGLAGFGAWWLTSTPPCVGPSPDYACVANPRPTGVAVGAFVGAALLGFGAGYVIVTDHNARSGGASF